MRWAWALAVFATVVIAACGYGDDDADESLDADEAAVVVRVNGRLVTEPALNRIVDLRGGQCFNDPRGLVFGESSTQRIEVVSCDGPWQYQVRHSFTVPASGGYPPVAFFDGEPLRCDRRVTFFVFPVPTRWDFGHRTVACLLERQ